MTTSQALARAPWCAPCASALLATQGYVCSPTVPFVACPVSQVLGRADSVKDFVRRGQTEGWVEITLSNGMGNRGLRTVRIKRLIRVDNSSKWFLNGNELHAVLRTFCVCNDQQPNAHHVSTTGSEATQTAVRETVGSFHVQLDNLCQFLPQDRVAAFAAMRPHELLEETEKAIGNAELFNHHQELKAMKQSLTGKQSVRGASQSSVLCFLAATLPLWNTGADDDHL